MLARALEQTLTARRFTLAVGATLAPSREEIAACLRQGDHVVVDGDLPSAAERHAILSIGSETADDGLLVEWRCTRQQAEREIYHRYAGRPRCLADHELEQYEADRSSRELATREESEAWGERLVAVNADMALSAQVAAVTDELSARGQPVTSGMGDSRRSVLVVEDDMEERLVLAEVLRELGWAVELAPDAAVALALLDGHDGEGGQFQLVLTDHCMPGMTGVELARELWRRHPEVRAVLLTAHDDEPTCADAVDAHAVSVLSKPVHILDLQRVLDEAALV